MLTKKLTVLTVTFVFFSTAAFAFDPTSLFKREEVPMAVPLFKTLWHGARIGLTTGFSAGWARYSPENDPGRAWKSAGFGALGGAAFGLGAGLIGKPVTANEILADTGFAGGIGASVGALVGAVMAITEDKTEYVGEGAAWGQLAGAAFGFLHGAYKAFTGGYSEHKEEELQFPLPFPISRGMYIVPSGNGEFQITYRKRF